MIHYQKGDFYHVYRKAIFTFAIHIGFLVFLGRSVWGEDTPTIEALFNIISKNDYEAADLFLQENPYLAKQSDSYGQSTLSYVIASWWDQPRETNRFCKLLLDLGADPNPRLPNLTDSEREDYSAHRRYGAFSTPLEFAVTSNNLQLVRLLLAHKADVSSPERNPPIIDAFLFADIELIRLLIDHGADIRVRNSPRHWTVVHAAAIREKWSEDIWDLALQSGYDINVSSGTGDTPLAWVISLNPDSADRVQILLDHGANPRNEYDGKPSQIAIVLNKFKSDMSYLLTENYSEADPKQRLLAVMHNGGYEGFINLLLSCGIITLAISILGLWNKVIEKFAKIFHHTLNNSTINRIQSFGFIVSNIAWLQLGIICCYDPFLFILVPLQWAWLLIVPIVIIVSYYIPARFTVLSIVFLIASLIVGAHTFLDLVQLSVALMGRLGWERTAFVLLINLSSIITTWLYVLIKFYKNIKMIHGTSEVNVNLNCKVLDEFEANGTWDEAIGNAHPKKDKNGELTQGDEGVK